MSTEIVMRKTVGPLKIVCLFLVNNEGHLSIHTKYDRYS